MKNRRSLYNTERSSSFVKTEVEDLSIKLWNPKHLELEIFHSASGRVPVLHYVIRPHSKYVIAGSLVDVFDEFLTWSFSDFTDLDAAFPLSAQLFAQTFSNRRQGAFLSRAIEPYSHEIHWFLCIEGNNIGPDVLNQSNLGDVWGKNDSLPEYTRGLVLLANKILDDLNPSRLQTMFRGIGWANRKIVIPALLGEVSDRIASTPKWLEIMKGVIEENEKISAYQNRFCVDDLHDVFL